jgi:hypothetical protein
MGRVQACRKSDRREGPSNPVAHNIWMKVSDMSAMSKSGVLHILLKPTHMQQEPGSVQ